MAFSGYLLAFGGKILPHEYIQLSTYEVLPYQRTELAAYRDNNNDLHRTTSSNHKTTIRFTTVPGLTLAQKRQLQISMASGIISNTERKYQITYWNDETNSYITGYFYMTDVSYTVRKISSTSIVYEPIPFEFIEY